MSQARSFLQSPSQQQVHIYLRNSQKRAHFIKIKKQIEYEQIRRIISDRIKLPIQKLVLFLKGEQLSQHGKIILNEKNIVHLVNLDNVHREYINIHIKRLEGEKLLTHFRVDSKSNIKEFIDTKLQEVFKHNSDEIFLVYTGKQLDISKNWEEEFVEDESELLCVNLDQSETPINQPSALTHHSKKKVDRSATEIELGPGKTYTESFIKKPAQSSNNAAPGSQQEIPIAPPNVWKKVNIPVESNPEDLKKPPNNTIPFQPKEETEHKLHSANRPRIQDIAQEERPILRSENPEPEAQNDAAHSQGLRVQLEKEIPQGSIERISQNIAINAQIASAPVTTEVVERSPVTLEAEDEVPKVESQPREEEVHSAEIVPTNQEQVQLVNLKAENCYSNEAISEEIPRKLESSPHETVNAEATDSAPATNQIVEEKITLEAEDEAPKVESHPQEEQKEEHKIQLTHQQAQIELRSGHPEQKQVSHQVVVEEIPNKLQVIALNIASNAVVTESVHETVEVSNAPIILEAEDEAPKVESQPKEEKVHNEEPHASQQEKVIEVTHHETVIKEEAESTEVIANDKENNQAIVYEAEDEAPRVESTQEPEAIDEETVEAKLESSPVVEEKVKAIPVHSEEKAAEVHEEPIQHVAASLIDQIKGKLNEKFKHESEEPKEQTLLKSEPQPILAEFNSANSLSSQVARGDLEGFINGTTQHVQELVAVGGEESEPLTVVLESAPTAHQAIEEKTTSLHAQHHQDLLKQQEIKHTEHEAVEKHINVVENVDSHHEMAHEHGNSEVHQLEQHAEAPQTITQHHENIYQTAQHQQSAQQHQEIHLPQHNDHAHSAQHNDHREYSTELHSAHQQLEVVVETEVVEEVKELVVLESAPVPTEADEVPHIEQNNEKSAVLEATTKEAVVGSEVPIAEDEAPRSVLKSSHEVEHQPEHHEAHEQAHVPVEHEEKPVQAEHHEQVHTIIEHHEEVTEEIHNLHAITQHQEHEHNDEVLHSHAPEHEQPTVEQDVQEVTAEYSEPTKEVQHQAVIDHPEEKIEEAVVHQQEVPTAFLESAPQEEGHSQIQKGEPNNDYEHNEVADHKEPQAIEHVEAIVQAVEPPVQLQSATAHHEQQVIAEHSQKHEEAETQVQTHHVPHIQAQFHTVEIHYEPEHKQIVEIVHQQHIETEEIHAVENKQPAESPKIHEPEHIEHIEVIHTHESAHVEHAVDALHSAPEHHQVPHTETEVVEEPVNAALESSPEPAAEENREDETNIRIVLESSPKEQTVAVETTEIKEGSPAENDELPHSNVSPQEAKEQIHIPHEVEEQPIEVHHVVATHEKVEPEATLHHAVDHQAHDSHSQEHKRAQPEAETAHPIFEHAEVQNVHEAQEETVVVLHSSPEEVLAHENEADHQVQSKHSEIQHHQEEKQQVHAQNQPEKVEECAAVPVLQQANHENAQHEVTQPEHKIRFELHQQHIEAVAEHQDEKSPEAHNESNEVQHIEPKILYGAQHHIDFGGLDINNLYLEVLQVGLEAVLPEETKQETVSHHEVEVAAEVEPVSAALEPSPAGGQVKEENTNNKTVIDTDIVLEAPNETVHTAVADDEIPHDNLQSSPQEQHHEPEHHEVSSKQAEHQESHTQVIAHEWNPPHHQDYVYQDDVPVKYNETPSVLERSIHPHEAQPNVQLHVPEQGLEHQHSDSLDEKPRQVIENPETPQIHVGSEPTFAASFPHQQHQEVPSSTQAPAQVPSQSDHLAQIDQFFNNNPIKLQALNNPLQSELNPSNSRLSEQSQGEFEKISVPMQQHIEFKAGDLIYSGEMHLNQTENLMQDILNDYSHLLAKSPQAFQETFGAHLK